MCMSVCNRVAAKRMSRFRFCFFHDDAVFLWKLIWKLTAPKKLSFIGYSIVFFTLFYSLPLLSKDLPEILLGVFARATSIQLFRYASSSYLQLSRHWWRFPSSENILVISQRDMIFFKSVLYVLEHFKIHWDVHTHLINMIQSLFGEHNLRGEQTVHGRIVDTAFWVTRVDSESPHPVDYRK